MIKSGYKKQSAIEDFAWCLEIHSNSFRTYIDIKPQRYAYFNLCELD